jgi:diguanylate cyclase (GGDEF)-like protein/PAS domain S-box-containing protein
MVAPAVSVLLVEDSAADAQITSDMLAFARDPRCDVTRVARLEEAQALLATEQFGVVLLDLGLPDIGGLDAVRVLRREAPDTAIIVLSGLGSQSIAVEALTAGAQDYLVKGRADEDTLQRSIRFAMARHAGDVARRRLAAIIESSDDAILTKDLDSRITSWNGGAERLYGYSADEAIGQRISMLTPPDRDGEDREFLARVLAGDRIQNHETRRVRRDGEIVDVSLSISTIRDGHGNVIAVSSIARDITESTRAAASLRAAQERFRIAFEKAPIGMALVGLDRRFIEVNAALAQLVGCDAADLVGRDMASIDHPDDPELDLDGVKSFIDGHTSYLGSDRRFQHAAGHAVWVTLSIAIVRDSDGEPQHYLAQMQDITARRGYEEQLRLMADQDPLSGLLNRRAFDRELRNHVARGERYGRAGAALMIDVDHFKYYNDTLGHQAGDALIARVARALAGRLRQSDVLARLGGDEFAVLLPGADEQAARRVAEELLECVRGETAPAPGEVHRELTASIGIAFFEDEPGLASEQVMVNADLALYEAKAGGRNRFVLHRSRPAAQPSMDRTAAAGP